MKKDRQYNDHKKKTTKGHFGFLARKNIYYLAFQSLFIEDYQMDVIPKADCK
jgi:hypothetical protein